MKKPKVFEEISVGTQRAYIRMDKATGIFSCEYGAESTHSPILQEVRDWASDAIRRLSRLEWKPIMKVSVNNNDMMVNGLRNCSNINMYFERMYIAWDGERWVHCPWVVWPTSMSVLGGDNPSEMDQSDYNLSEAELAVARLSRARVFNEASGPEIKFPLVPSSGFMGTIYFVPYTADLWQTMEGILQKLRQLREGIKGLLETENGWLQLSKIAGAGSLLAQGDIKQ